MAVLLKQNIRSSHPLQVSETEIHLVQNNRKYINKFGELNEVPPSQPWQSFEFESQKIFNILELNIQSF